MKSLPCSLSGFIAIFLLLTSGLAYAGTPQLVGSWSGTYDVATPDGVKKSSLVLTISKQDGALLFATRTWQRKDASQGQHRGHLVTTAVDKLLGVIDHDNRTVFFVKSGPGPESLGIFKGHLSGKKLNLLFLQPGEVARASRITLTRIVKK